MKQSVVNMAIFLGWLSLLTGCHTMPATQPEDARMNAAIKGRLVEVHIDLARAGVDTQDGFVYLSGVVPSTDHKVRAEQVARDVQGVNQVVNNLQVQP
jgi:osmotically-inducible protein OsmY